MMKIIKRFLRTIKSRLDLNTTLSILAIVISTVTMYFQFFSKKHDLLYAFMYPTVADKLEIPIIYKNNGDYNELILESNIELEIIPDDGSEKYFKRIGDENKKSFPLILAPGNFKVINILGDYKEYFKGMMEYTDSGLKYRAIVNFDTLSVVVTTKFISRNGIGQTRRHIGKITFKKDKSFDRMDICPIVLKELEADEDIVMTGGSIVNAGYEMNINFGDSLTSDQIEQVKFTIQMVDDTIFKNHLIREFKLNQLKYPIKQE